METPPETTPRDGGDEAARPGWLDKLKNELAAAVVIAGGIMLGTGWLLTWARLSSEGLPSESILTALPSTYYVQVALRATLAPVLILVSLGACWVVLSVRLVRAGRWGWGRAVLGWSLFGAGLALVSWQSAVWLNPATSRGGGAYVFWNLLAGAATIGLSSGLGWWIHRRRLEWIDTSDHWPVARPIVAVTIVLCFVAGATLRVVDARFAKEGLPIGQVVVGTPCVELTGGNPLSTPNSRNADADSGASRCQLGGFYIGETSEWVLLVKRSNPCPGRPQSPPFLLALPRSDVQQLAIYPTGSYKCPPRGAGRGTDDGTAVPRVKPAP